MEQSPSTQAYRHLPSQEIPQPPIMETSGSLPCSQQPTTLPFLIQMHLDHTFPTCSLRSILILSFHLRLGLLSDLFPSGFPTTLLYAFITSPMRATCPNVFILLGVILLIISVEAYKLRSFSLCSLLQSRTTFSLFGQIILLSTLFLNTICDLPLY